MMFKI